MKRALYSTKEEKFGRGLFFTMKCCGRTIYSFHNDPMRFHNKLCPCCLMAGRMVTVFNENNTLR